MASTPANERPRLLLALVLAGFSFSCGASDHDAGVYLGVQLITDLRPGDEFSTVEVALEDGSVRRTKVQGEDYLAPQRIADFTGLTVNARRRLTVRLLDRKGGEVLERKVELDHRRSTTRTVTLTRDCIDVRCEGSKASCLAGVCVDPRCMNGMSSADARCEVDRCESDGDCSTDHACAQGLCRLGTCLVASGPLLCMDAGTPQDAGPNDASVIDAALPDASADSGIIDPGTRPPRCDGGICRLDAACASFDFELHRYWLCELRQTYAEALAFCAADGAQLVVINDEEEGKAIASRIAFITRTTGFSSQHFIGLHDQDSPGTYTWIDGTPLDYQNWRKGEPSSAMTMVCATEDCGTIYASGAWNDACCVSKLAFVCEAGIP